MKVGVTGANGAIGKALVPLLIDKGHTVTRFVRTSPKTEEEAYWNPEKTEIDLDVFQKMDAIIHLAGEPIAPLDIPGFLPFSGDRWTKKKKAKIYWSRRSGAETFVEAYKKSKDYPSTFISASAIGIYGDQGDIILDEDSEFVRGSFDQYVPEEAWEKPLSELNELGVRVINARTGIVLGPSMPIVTILKFIWGLNIAGPIGGGNQYWPWVSIDDVLHGYLFCLDNENIKGPVNIVSPTPIKQKEFSQLLAKEMKKIAILPIPGFAVMIALGPALADSLVLSSHRVIPAKLLKYGYVFKDEYLKNFIKEIV